MVGLRGRSTAGAFAVALLSTPVAAQEKPAGIIAAQIRTQGYACEKALGAHATARPRSRTKPYGRSVAATARIASRWFPIWRRTSNW
jgi:hypothetical protein